MDKQVGLKVSPRLLQSYPTVRRGRMEAIFGRDWKIAIPFVLPIIIIMGGLILWPFINAIMMSMTVRSLVTRTEAYVGLDNYARLLHDSDFIRTVQNTLVFTIGSVCVKSVVGMIIALLLNSRLPFRNILTSIMLLPWIVPEVVTALTWRSIYDPIFGGLNPILMSLGIIDHSVAWLADPGLAMPSVIAVNVWKGIPFYTILLLAGLKAIDHDQYEAAEVDGAGPVQRFRHITLPGLKYVIIVTVLLSFISTFNTFGLIYLMTGGGPGGATRVFSILAYEKAIVGLRFGPGIATAFSMAPFMALLIFVLARLMRPDQRVNDDGRESRMDIVLGWAGRGLGILLDWVFLPLEWISDLGGWAFRTIVRLFSSTGEVRLKRAQRERHRYEQSDGAAVTDAAVCSVPILLDCDYVIQVHHPDSTGGKYLLADPLDTGAVPVFTVRYPVCHLVPQYDHRGDPEHGHLGGGGCVGRLCTGTAQVFGRGDADDTAAGHLPASGVAAVHPTLPHPDAILALSTPTRRSS